MFIANNHNTASMYASLWKCLQWPAFMAAIIYSIKVKQSTASNTTTQHLRKGEWHMNDTPHQTQLGAYAQHKSRNVCNWPPYSALIVKIYFNSYFMTVTPFPLSYSKQMYILDGLGGTCGLEWNYLHYSKKYSLKFSPLNGWWMENTSLQQN